MMTTECTDPTGSHLSPDDEALCPLHRGVALARLEPVRPAKPVAPLAPPEILDGFMSARVEIEGESSWRADGLNRPARHLRVIGNLTLHDGTSAEGCTVDGEIEAWADSSVDNCHVVDLGVYVTEYRDEPEQYLSVSAGASANNSTATHILAAIVSPSGPGRNTPKRESRLINCHAYRTIRVGNGDAPVEVDRCTAGLAIITTAANLSLNITHPGQVLAFRGDLARATRREYPVETTILIPEDSPMFEPLLAASEGDDSWVTARIAEMKAVVTRPKDGSQGPWIDARNNGAWDMIFEPRQQDFPAAPVGDEEIELAVALYPNP